MLEFAYTGEVNVGQELLPSLLHTARCFRIKGLDNVQTPPGLLDHNASQAGDQESEHWAGSLPPTRPHTPPTRPHTPSTRPHTPPTRPHTPQTIPHSPSSVQSSQDIKPVIGQDNFLVSGPGASPTPRAAGSLPPTLPTSPHTLPSREPSPHQHAQQHNARTPPPKRWKRSFDLARTEVPEDMQEQVNGATPLNNRQHEVNGLGATNFSEAGAKRFCDGEAMKRFSSESAEDGKQRFVEAETEQKRFCEPPRVVNYPHSMPASPTMLDARNFNSLGLLRHFARVGSDGQGMNNGLEPREAHENSRVETRAAADPIDYHQYNSETNPEIPRGSREEEAEQQRRERLAFRPESAPTLLDMSPEGSLSGPPSIRSYDVTESREHDERINHFRNIVVGILPTTNGGDLSDCVNKVLSSSASGRYTCDECGKLFKHPGSLQHHRHIHRGTHRCPTCGKAFSRRWDMERHLNKSKYGCPANRFSASGSPLPTIAPDCLATPISMSQRQDGAGQGLVTQVTLAPAIAHAPANGTAT